ncbi:hypothetical protein CP533_3084 [Ophiocordyceps camponoti-saundersi (nom. inval.)]|nr:hypothetical protein CP533_3084 [Ophiocordyceps camponoti-saundersi (nom. inval.)]
MGLSGKVILAGKMIVNLMLLHVVLAAPAVNNAITVDGNITFTGRVTLNNTVTYNNTKVTIFPTRKCIQGSSTGNSGLEFQYERVQPSSAAQANNSIIDPGFLNSHATPGNSILWSGNGPSQAYAESRCQLSCNAMLGFRMPGNLTDFECLFLNDTFGDAQRLTGRSINPANIVTKPASGNATLLNAYNRLCGPGGGVGPGLGVGPGGGVGFGGGRGPGGIGSGGIGSGGIGSGGIGSGGIGSGGIGPGGIGPGGVGSGGIGSGGIGPDFDGEDFDFGDGQDIGPGLG